MGLFDSDAFTYVLLPVLIFVARICDVTIGTVRIISVSRGHKYLAPVLGFFEVLIWIIVIAKVMQNLNNMVCYVAYAGGFAAGNFVGIMIEQRIAIGTLIIRIITRKEATELVNRLTAAGYGVTSLVAEGGRGPVNVIYSVIKRGDLAHIVDIIGQVNPRAFYSVEDVRFVSEGVFPQRKSFLRKEMFALPAIRRKGK